MVFCIFALVTMPTFSWWWRGVAPLRACPSWTPSTRSSVRSVSSAIALLAFLFLQDREQTRPILSKFPQLVQRFGLSHRHLKTKLEHLFNHFHLMAVQFIDRHVADLFHAFRGFHFSTPFSRRITNFVCTGSFCAARRIASRATVSGTPSIS